MTSTFEQNGARKARHLKRERLRDEIPRELICPLTLTMFRDPVMVTTTGHTFERQAILEHIKFCNDRGVPAYDPVCRTTMTKKQPLMTNWTVRDTVQRYLDQNPDMIPDGWETASLLPPSIPLPPMTIRVGSDDPPVLFKYHPDQPLGYLFYKFCTVRKLTWPRDKYVFRFGDIELDDSTKPIDIGMFNSEVAYAEIDYHMKPPITDMQKAVNDLLGLSPDADPLAPLPLPFPGDLPANFDRDTNELRSSVVENAGLSFQEIWSRVINHS